MKHLVAAVLLTVFVSIETQAQTTIYWKRDTIYAGPGGGAIATVTPVPSDTTAPSAPTSLSSTSTLATSVSLQWTQPSGTCNTDFVGFKIYRQKASGISLPVGTVACSASSSTRTFVDEPLLPSTSYTYTIVAFDDAQNHSSASNSVNPTTSAASTDTTAPSAPPQLTAQVLGSSSVKLNWLAATDAGGSGIAGYRVKRGGSDVSGWLSATALTYTDNAAPQNSSLTYTVEAKDGQTNVSSASNSAGVTTPLESIAPSTPGSPSASGLTFNSIRVSWTASSDTGGSGLSGYKVYRAGTLISGGSPVTGTSFDETGLTINTTYTNYTIKAIDGAGNLSAAAGPVSGATLPDTTPPTTPASCSISWSDPWLGFSWSASTDSGGSGLAGYGIFYVDTAPTEYSIFEDPVSGTSTDPINTTGWTWDYFAGFVIRAVDGAGNLSSARACTE